MGNNRSNHVLMIFDDHANDRIAATIELEAMKAENERCKYDGICPKYGEDDFLHICELFGLRYGDLIQKNAEFFNDEL